MSELDKSTKAIVLIFIAIIVVCLFAYTAYFNSLLKVDSEFAYQKIAIGGLVAMLVTSLY